MGERAMKASDFKAKCLHVMDEINETGDVVTITKNGRPVARLVPFNRPHKSLWGSHAGQIEIMGDIVGPVLEDFESPE
jgi:prevent-host-death family protein